MMRSESAISRRRFLSRMGGATFVLTLGSIPAIRNTLLPDHLNEELSPWVHLNELGQITFYNPAAEMGQGSMTALAAIFAEEMDVPWSQVHIDFSPIEPDTYGLQWGGKLGGPMITVGSRTVRGYYRGLRLAGAEARYIMRHNAAREWGVAVDEVSTSPGKAVHISGSELTYGALAANLQVPKDMPAITDLDLKKSDEFQLIGTFRPRADIPAKVTGEALYSIDVNLPGLLYGVISRSPVNGAKPSLQNETTIRSMPGIESIVKLEHGIGILGDTFEHCLNAKKAMQIEWSSGNLADDYNSEMAYDIYTTMAQADDQGEILQESGSVQAAFQEATKIYDISYQNDFVYHAQMEPLNAVVSVAPDGRTAEAWVGSQSPDGARRAIADAIGVEFEDVTLHPCYLGGGFGRRSMSDYVEEAALLSKAIRKPVKLVWTREDDVQYGAFRPISLQRMRAVLDQEGRIQAWGHRIVGTGDGLLASGARIPYYTIPNQLIDLHNVEHGVRTKHWRSVGHGPNKYAIEAFIDEIAHDTGQDPYEMRQSLLREHPREMKVLDKVAGMSSWGSQVPEGRGRGMAFIERSGAFVAGVAEISIERSTGQIKVHHFWLAMDAGVVVQPDNAIAQLEGGLLFGLSSVLYEQITFRKGAVQASNFHNYRVARMSDLPESIHIEIIESTEPPAGIGEASTPVVGGAIANAFLALTGKPLRHMPFTAEKVKQLIS